MHFLGLKYAFLGPGAATVTELIIVQRTLGPTHPTAPPPSHQAERYGPIKASKFCRGSVSMLSIKRQSPSPLPNNAEFLSTRTPAHDLTAWNLRASNHAQPRHDHPSTNLHFLHRSYGNYLITTCTARAVPPKTFIQYRKLTVPFSLPAAPPKRRRTVIRHVYNPGSHPNPRSEAASPRSVHIHQLFRFQHHKLKLPLR